MITRREALFGGLGGFMMGLLPSHLRYALATGRPTVPGFEFGTSAPLAQLPEGIETIDLGGFTFAKGFTGDPYPDPHALFPDSDEWIDRQPPPPTEEVQVAIVGGGISGLSAAYMLREFDPVLFELNPRYGGSARGEQWLNIPYSLGGAYVITPDPGSFLDEIYTELGLREVVREDKGQFELELDGQIVQEEFWSGRILPPEEAAAIEAYQKVVQIMAGSSYPCIPPTSRREAEWVNELDGQTLKQNITDQMGMEPTPLLSAAVQAYCYSSFGRGWEEISAAGGWNFLAAEEYGRWVFPGGNAYMCQQFWNALVKRERPDHRGLRPGTIVVDVRLHPKGVQVTWFDVQKRELHSLLAQRVVMCCPKNVCRQVMSDVARLDPKKFDAMHLLGYTGYVVANVLIDSPTPLDFYDIFLLADGNFPTDQAEAMANSRVIDVLNGHFALVPNEGPRSVLTLYWPLPWNFGQHTLLNGRMSWRDYAVRLVPQLPSILELVGTGANTVRQVRLSYFGHGMPWSFPGFIQSGAADHVRRPYEGQVYFVQQDNWALPAVENCLLDAAEFVPEIAAALR